MAKLLHPARRAKALKTKLDNVAIVRAVLIRSLARAAAREDIPIKVLLNFVQTLEMYDDDKEED